MAQDYSLNLGLDIVPITTDVENIQDMYRLYNAVKGVATALDGAASPVSKPKGDWSTLGTSAIRTQNLARMYIISSDTLIPGTIVAIYDAAGVPKVRRAGGASMGNGLAVGFVQANVAIGEYCEVFLEGINTYISGLTIGGLYYTSTVTAGAVSLGATSPYIQTVGIALSTTALWFKPLMFAR